MYFVSSLCCCRPLTVECEAVVGSIYSRAAEVKVVMGHAHQGIISYFDIHYKIKILSQ